MENWDLDVLSYIYSATNPQEPDGVAEFQSRWGMEPDYLDPDTGKRFKPQPLIGVQAIYHDLDSLGRLVDFLQYSPLLPPGKETTVEVRYSHLLDVDAIWDSAPRGTGIALQFQYILHTSPKWKNFGPIRLTLAIPSMPKYALSPKLDFVGEQNGYDVYRSELKGSEMRENLLAAIQIREPWDERQHQMTLSEKFDRQAKSPNGPFADEDRGDIANGLLWHIDDDPDRFTLFDKMGIDPGNAAAKLAEARDLFGKIPPDRSIQYLATRLPACLADLRKEGVTTASLAQTETRMLALRKQLQDAQKRTGPGGLPCWFDFTRDINQIDTWVELIRAQRHQRPGAGKDKRWEDFLSSMAGLEIELRLLDGELRFTPLRGEFPHFFEHVAIYDRYFQLCERFRDLPEQNRLFNFLLNCCEYFRSEYSPWSKRNFPPGSAPYFNPALHNYLDFLDRLDQAARARGITEPQPWSPHRPGESVFDYSFSAWSRLR